MSIIVNDASLPGGTKQIDYTVQGGDTLADIARELSAAITSDSDMQSSHINAFAVMAADSPSSKSESEIGKVLPVHGDFR